jgi:hypothetical protein
LRNLSDFRRGSSGPEDKKNSSEFFDMREEVTLTASSSGLQKIGH